MQEGNILSIDTPDTITNQFEVDLWAIKAADKYRLIQTLRDYEFAESVQPFGEYVHYTDRRPHIDQEKIATYLESQGFTNLQVKKAIPDIEDMFIRLMEIEGAHG
jgi:ABC-type multidrug transport system ATPase subunit